MTKHPFLVLGAILTGSLLAQPPAPPKTHLKVGDAAPDFELGATNNTRIKLSDFRGKKNVVLAFFPAAFTGGWTKELGGYQAGIEKFDPSEIQILGISTDNVPSLRVFAEQLKLSYPIVSDFMRKTAAEYGVLIPDRGMANRTTFVIDMEGKITYIEEGNTAVDITGAATACSRLKKH